MKSHGVFVDDYMPGEIRDEPAAPGWFGQALFHKAVGPRETPTAEQCLSSLVFLAGLISWIHFYRSAGLLDGQSYLKLV